MNKPNRKLSPEERREESKQKRITAAQIAFDRGVKKHNANGDENLPFKMMSFTKGLPHNFKTGLIQDENDFDLFVNGICSGDPEDIKATPLGPVNGWESDRGQLVDKVRAWESTGAGLTFDLEGPDAQAVTMKPAPALGSDELSAEMAEVYAQANLRDIQLSKLGTDPKVKDWFHTLLKLDYFGKAKRTNFRGHQIKLTRNNLFRGLTQGDLKGPYLSQFLLAGNNGLNKKAIQKGEIPEMEFKASDGYINYGSITIDQRVRIAKGINYMTEWKEFIDVQNGADFRELEEYTLETDKRRFITTGRDLATYVHYDALYEAYLNACLLLLGAKAPFDKGVPFQGDDNKDKQQGFAHYGGPHILTLVTEVATRALKAVRYQKFNIHRRLRPEALAARLHKKDTILDFLKNKKKYSDWNSQLLEKTFRDLEEAKVFDQFSNYGENKNLLLPMAFAEGSPMHPSYGAGHATVAGACVTILKAFFNHDLFIIISEDGKTIEFSETAPEICRAFVPNSDGTKLNIIETAPLTVKDELNKLAANISIGRNWAGVHYYSDYRESLLLGEEIAIGLLEEQAITYNLDEGFYMTLPKFNEDEMRIPRKSMV